VRNSEHRTNAISVPRTWQVLLLGGASGVGKTHVSYRLAQHYAVGITEVDDFHVILERMTTPEQQPERARASWRHSEWLRQEAARLGVPTLPARPWDTLLTRAIATLR
jgi:2-phosphoglycerate kinase